MLKLIYNQKTKISLNIYIHEERSGPFITEGNYLNQAPDELSKYAEHGFRLAYETLIIVYVMY